MSPELTIIDTEEDLAQLFDYLQDQTYVAYDIETTGVNTSDEIIGFSVCAEETKAFYVVIAKWQEGALHYTGLKEPSKRVIELLKAKQLICHNGIFDCMMTSAYFKTDLIANLYCDTMILAHLLDENRRVGLKELGASMYGESAAEEQRLMKASVIANGGVLTKAKYELYKADWELMARYGAQDAILTYRLFMDLIPQLFDQGLDDFFFEESMPLLRGPAYDLNTIGIKLDSEALTKLKKQLEMECAEAKAYIYDEIAPYIKQDYPATTKKNVFNIGSSQQLSWLLFGKMELEFHTLTKAGKVFCKDKIGMKIPYSYTQKREFIHASQANNVKPWKYLACDKEALKKHSERYKWIAKLLEYQKKQKILNTYVIGIEERVKYGVVRPSFLMHGTTSGRFSSRNPNLQNLPRDDQRVKECFVARPGKVFVGADYSQLEPRVFAFMSGDERLKAAFLSSDDFYSVIGMEMYGKTDCLPIKDGHPDAFGIKYKKLRDLSKVITLASTYGATAFQLMKTTGKSADDTQMDIDNYFESFPGVAQMMLDSHQEAKDKGQVTNLFGRPRRMPEAKSITKRYGNAAHSELPYEVRNLLNLATNHRIQSTGASIMNRAMIRFYKNINDLGLNCKIVSQIHDELIAECLEEDADLVSLILQDAMETTTELPGVPLEAIPRITKTLAK